MSPEGPSHAPPRTDYARAKRLGIAWAVTLACLTATSATSHAQGQSRVRIAWPEAAPCPAPIEFDAQLARLLGDRYARLPETTFDVELKRIEPLGYELSLQFSGSAHAHARSVRLNSCSDVQEATILLAAMALEPGAPSAPPPTAVSPPEHAEQHAFQLAVQAMLDLWSLPAVSVGPNVDARMRVGPVWLGLAGRYLAPRTVDGAPQGTSAKVDLLSGAALIGWHTGDGRVTWGPEAELELGYLRGRATGTVEGNQGGALWAAIAGGLALRVRLHPRAALNARGLVEVPLRRPSFGLRDESAFYTTQAASLRIFLGVSFALGATD